MLSSAASVITPNCLFRRRIVSVGTTIRWTGEEPPLSPLVLRSGDSVSDWAALGLRDDVPAHVVIVTKYEPNKKDFIIKAIR